MKRFVALLFVVVVSVSGCAQKVDLAAERDALRQADENWSASIAGKSGAEFAEAMLASVAPNGIMMPPNHPAVEGTEAVREWATKEIAPGMSVSWKVAGVEVSSSGDMGYTHGTYEFVVAIPDQAPMTDRGKYTTIWTKDAAGVWKVALDIFNSDMPMEPMPQASEPAAATTK